MTKINYILLTASVSTGCVLVVSGLFLKVSIEQQEVFYTYSQRVEVQRSRQLQHAVFSQDSLSLCVRERQCVDDDVQDGHGLLLAPHAHQLQEVLPVWEGQEDKLRSLAKHPGVVGGQRHLVGIPE